MTAELSSSVEPNVLVLGPVRVVGASSSLQGRQAALVGTLVLAAPHPVPQEELGRWVFGFDGPRRLDDLRVLVSRFRRQLRDEGLSATVVHEGCGYALVGASTDAAAFEHLVERALGVEEDDPGAASTFARAATDLWRGDWTVWELFEHPAVVRLGERRLSALEVRFRAELNMGRHGPCLADLLEACHAYPYAEDLWRGGMIALYRSGRQVEALALYREIRTRLVEDLGVEPGLPLQQTELQILTHDVAEFPGARSRTGRSTPDAIDADSRVLGAWRGMPDYDDSYFEDQALAAHFRHAVREHRHVTVTGAAGAGKTRLVAEQLPALATRWPDGATFCELSSVDGGVAVALQVAAATGSRVPAGGDPIDAIAEHLSTGTRLLVLDTCEHVIAPICEITDELLRRCPSLSIIATSRCPLGLTGELAFPMPTLDAPTLGVELFIDRTRRAGRRVLSTADDRSAIEVLCTRLDGLPLAIELAASRTRAFSPAELVDRLDRRLALLQAPRFGAADRHASLRASFEWSYLSLDIPEQRVFRALGAFAGDTDLAAVEEVSIPCAGDAAVALGNLVDQSLVVARRRGAETRYRLLDSVRAYARELLEEAGERDATLLRHARCVAGRKDEYVALAEGPGERDAVARLNEFWPDLRMAVNWAIANGRRREAFDLLAGLGTSAILRERTEVRDWADSACRLAGPADADMRLHEVLAAQAIADWTVADFAGGIERSDRAHELAVAAGAPLSTDVLVASMLNGGARDQRSFAELCRGLAREAAAAGSLMGETWAFNGEGMAHAYQGRSTEALAALARSRRLADRLGCPSQLALCEMARTIALLDDDPTAALAAADEAIAHASEVGSTWLFGATPNYRAAALVRAGESGAAVKDVRRTLHRLAAGGSTQSVANTVRNAIALLDRLGFPQRAAILVAWLDENPVGIPGTPGMRQQVVDLRTRLTAELGEEAMIRHAEEVANFSLQEVVDEAIRALDDLA